MRFFGRWLLATAFTAVMAVAPVRAQTAPDPVSDCPTGLVCFTILEAQQIARTRASLEFEVAKLQAFRPRKVAPFLNVGGHYLPTGDVHFGGYIDVGLRFGPFAVGVGGHDYGYGIKPHIGVNFHKEF